MDKDVQPGKWDTAVGGHLDAGESFEKAVRRELAEELGFTEDIELEHLFDSKIRNEIESENVRVYSITHPGPFAYQKEEIDEIRFWTADELKTAISETPEAFTPNLLDELEKLEFLDV
jgi:isopentenyldiphosphate isomerase